MPNLDLTIAEIMKGDTPVAKIMKGDVQKWPCPYDAEVEYLQSSGTQFINTGIVPTNTTGLYIDMQKTTSSDGHYMGVRETSGNTRLLIGASSTYYYGWGDWWRFSGTGNNNRHVITLNFYNSRITDFDNGLAKNLATLRFTPTLPIYIFKANDAASTTTPRACKIYAAKITSADTLVRDFIPVRKDGVGYLYDKVSGELFGNAGTGDFIIGSDK